MEENGWLNWAGDRKNGFQRTLEAFEGSRAKKTTVT